MISAHGKGFSDGGDLKEIDRLDGHEGILGQCLESARACTAISRCSVPVMVVVHDYCLGVGIELVGSADIALANEAALFQWTEVDNGTVGGAAQGFRMLPPQVLRHLMFTSEPVTVRDLWIRGALTRCCQLQTLMREHKESLERSRVSHPTWSDISKPRWKPSKRSTLKTSCVSNKALFSVKYGRKAVPLLGRPFLKAPAKESNSLALCPTPKK